MPDKINGIFKATRTHATNLAKFVTLYKVLLLLQKKLNGGKERDLDTFISGALGGWFVFGERTAVSPHVFHSTQTQPLTRGPDQRADCPLCHVASDPIVHPETILHIGSTPLTSTPTSSAPFAVPHLARGQSKTNSTFAYAIRHRSGLGVGRCHVHLQTSRREATAWNGQLDE